MRKSKIRRRTSGPMEPPSDLKMVGTPVTEEEIAYPNADDLPTDEPLTPCC